MTNLLLADLGYERNADSIRGFVVLAWLCALFATVSGAIMTRSIRRKKWEILTDHNSIAQRGLPFMKHTLSVAMQLFLGFAVIAGIAHVSRFRSSSHWSAVNLKHPSEATVLAAGNDGTLHVGSRAGYFQVNRREKEIIPNSFESRDLRNVRGLLIDEAKNQVWIGCQNGLFLTGENTFAEQKLSDGNPLGPVFSLYRGRNGLLFAGGAKQLYQKSVNAQPWEALGREVGVTLNQIGVIYEDRKGRLWLGNDSPRQGGLLLRNAGQENFIDASSGLPHLSVCDMQETADGALWVATGFAGSGGAAKWDESASVWRALDGPPGLKNEKIRSLFIDSTDGFWFCSEYNGIALRSGGQWHQRLYRDGFPCREIKDTVEIDGGFWLATERGVIFLDRNPIDEAPEEDNPGERP